MASQLLGIKTRFTNDLGSPLVGGQVYTYFAGTSTNQDSYSDAALTVPNTNPVILDDTGSADIFLKGAYRIRVFDKSGRFIEEQDNVTQAASQGDTTELTNKISAVEDGLSAANTEIDKVKLDTGITATAKFGGVERSLSDRLSDTLSFANYEPDTTGNIVVDAKLQAAVDASKSASKTLIVQAGTYKLSIGINITDANIHCERGVVFDWSESTQSGSCFTALGSTDAELDVSAYNAKTYVASVTGGSGLAKKDDVIFKSAFRCDLPDEAGDMCLGAGTAGVGGVYFGEVMEVLSSSSNSVTFARGALFDKYSVTKNGVVGTIKKVNWGKTTLTGYPLIKLKNTVHCSGLYATLQKDSVFELKGEASYSTGHLVTFRNCYNSKLDSENRRPHDWTLESDHSGYNSYKSTSGWYNTFNLVEYYGSQSVDQTYTDLPSIGEKYVVVSHKPKEQGFTSHGMSYGLQADITVYDATSTAVTSRARFSQLKVTAYNNSADKSDVKGVSLMDYGMTDVTLDVNLTGFSEGVRLTKSFSAVAHGPETVQCSIKGTVANTGNTVRFYSKFVDDFTPNSRIVIDMQGNNVNGIVSAREGSGWNSVIVSGTYIINPESTSSILINGTRGRGWCLKNLDVSGYGVGTAVMYANSTDNTYPDVAMQVDWKSCVFRGSGTITSGYNYIPNTVNTTGLVNILSKWTGTLDTVVFTGNDSSTLDLTNAVELPVGKEITILTPNSGLVNVTSSDDTYNIISKVATGSKYVKMLRYSTSAVYVWGSN